LKVKVVGKVVDELRGRMGGSLYPNSGDVNSPMSALDVKELLAR
jgi:hypothetical protein